jgi:putative ATP-dependent endonuclease of OLD family
VLTGRVQLSEALFNKKIVKQYLKSLDSEEQEFPPKILIELYLNFKNDSVQSLFEGNGNSTKQKACGIQFKIEFNECFQSEYNLYLAENNNFLSLPIEYYDFKWSSFARDERVTPRAIPLKSILIDSVASRNQSGSDIYISKIVRNFITEEQKVRISQAHRNLKDSFSSEEVVKNINEDLEQKIISDKKIELSVDLSSNNAWETSLATYIDKIPFNCIGMGEQCLVKTKLALCNEKAEKANVILLEEPENHLSHTKLNQFVSYIIENRKERQIIISTHSSFVANKIGLENLILLNVDKLSKRNTLTLTDLKPETFNFYKKLPGYETLRLLICSARTKTAFLKKINMIPS